MKLGFASEDDTFGYAIALGSAAPSSVPKLFQRDPEIKHEAVWAGPAPRPASLLVQREGPSLRLRDEGGRGWIGVARPVPGWASMMTEHADPRSAPEMLTLREQLRRWRFYDHFRSDADAPARQPRLGSFTPVLAADGADVAAAWASIAAIGDHDALAEAVDDAFPGARVSATLQAGDRFALEMRQPGLLRPLQLAELSDGTLRYLLWVAALLTPRPPPLLVLNEPETSLHPDLLPALGRLIARAAAQTQVIVVSHANRLLAALEAAAPESGYLPLHLDKHLGETVVANLPAGDLPRWSWLD
jgi:predicted ATPase